MKEYSDDLIEEIKENIDIVDFIGEYVELTKKGKRVFPVSVHSMTRELVRSVLHQTKKYVLLLWLQKGGDVITFCQEHLNMSYERAVSYLCGIAGLVMKKTEISTTVKYLKKQQRKKKETTIAGNTSNPG